MASTKGSILPLSAVVVAQIKSSTVITSLNGVVLELLKNALDAEATKVEIIIDYRRGDCTVEDDGHGIPPAEFCDDGGLGKMYCTSKHDPSKKTHGQTGTFLSSLAALSLLTITSHHYVHRSHNTVSLHHSKPISRLTPAPAHQHLSCRDHGARIIVRDLFGNMPVRVKQRAMIIDEQNDSSEKDWQSLKRGIVAVLLAWGRPVSIVLRDVEKNRKIILREQITNTASALQPESSKKLRERDVFDLALARSILSQASYISPSHWDTWIPISARTPFLSIKGSISLKPAPTKQIQFLSFGISPISAESGHNMLYQEINRIFTVSQFGSLEVESDIDDMEKDIRMTDKRYKNGGPTAKQLKGRRKGVDRWPMFCLWIELERRSCQGNLPEDDRLDNQGNLRIILDTLGALVRQFLSAHHFRPQRSARSQRMRGTIERWIPEQDGTTYKEPSKNTSSGSDISFISIPNPSLDLKNYNHQISDRLRSASNRSQSKPSQELRRSALTPNILGSNDKLTSFSQFRGHSYRSAFNERSRVKSARRDAVEEIYDGKTITRSRMSVPSHMYTQGDSHPEGTSLSRSALPQPIRPSFFSTGVVLPGQLNLATESPVIESGEEIYDAASEQTDLSMDQLGEQDTLDNAIKWTNPISRTTFFIDSRTGLLIPPDARKHTSASLIPESPCGSPSTNGKRLSISSSQSSLSKDKEKETGKWINGLLAEWDNPVFRPAEDPIPQISLKGPGIEAASTLHGRNLCCSHLDIENAFLGSSSHKSGKLSKSGLHNAEIIAQVDRKFILVKMDVNQDSQTQDEAENGNLLVIIDQHAADERCRIEALLAELCSAPAPAGHDRPRSNLGFASRITTLSLPKPLTFQISPQEQRLFKMYAEHFADWGIQYDLCCPSQVPSLLESQRKYYIVVRTLPPGIIERCKVEAKVLIDLLRAEVWKRDEEKGSNPISKGAKDESTKPRQEADIRGLEHEIVVDVEEDSEHKWVRQIGGCPQGILDMLNSRSCRSAIMFNDELTLDECRKLVTRLADCAFPFQCAHGRPSMIPLVNLNASTIRPDASSITANIVPGSGVTDPSLAADFGNRGNYMEAFREWRKKADAQAQDVDT
ncbi:MAG: DNA mismatch repair protein [Pycnora praestabilis]|nr:MAG: DNA mismatch repair protein [Pycnora praestabilis]